MANTYPHPPRRFPGFRRDADGTLHCAQDQHLKLQIRRFTGIGWELEVCHKNTLEDARHIYTGAQESLPISSIAPEEKNGLITWSDADETLSANLHTGALCLVRNGQEYWSAHEPFAGHTEPQELYEGIMSMKVTNFSERSPFGPIGSQFFSHMVRFQYDKPVGPILGLPGQTGELNRGGYRFQLYNTDTFMHTPDRPPMYQSWPILFHRDIRGAGWTCVFHDNPSRTFVDVGDFYSDHITFESQYGPTRVYIMHGDSLLDVSQKLTRLLGGCRMPPDWAFGYQQCRWSYMSTEELRMVAKKMKDEDIPCNALYFDIDYMDEFRVFTCHPERFKDLHTCIDDLHKQSIKTVCVVDPGVKIDPNNSTYKRVLTSKKILTTQDGKPFIAKVWPGESIFPDFREEEMQELWANMQREWLELFPFEGVWNDMNEPSNFNGQNQNTSMALHADGTSVNEDWNLYGYHMARASRRGMEKAGKSDGLVITRSGYPGVQQHAVIWHGDNQAWWEHLRLAIDTTITYSLCGAFYTGPDVPGFTGNPPDDLAVRFFQLGAWLPLFRGHSIYFAKDKEPYAFGAKARRIIKRVIHERTAKQQEWLDEYRQACDEHRSPILPTFSENGTLVRDQFLLFNRYLVAPIVERDQERRTVWLPDGNWCRLHGNNNIIQGGKWLTEKVTLEHIPVFMRH